MGQSSVSGGNEREQTEELLELDLIHGWKLVRRLEQAVQIPSRFHFDESESSLANEHLDDLLSKRSAYIAQLAHKHLEERASLQQVLTSLWTQLQQILTSLGKMKLEEMNPELEQAAERLMEKYEWLVEEYVQFAGKIQGQGGLDEMKEVMQRKTRLEDALNRLKEENNRLLAEISAAKSDVSAVDDDLEGKNKENTDISTAISELSGKISEFEDDLAVKRELLQHRKEELSNIRQNNTKLSSKIRQFDSMQSQNELTAELKQLINEKEAAQKRIIGLESELEQRNREISGTGKKMKQLETALKASEEQKLGPGDLNVRMHSMQSTLHELYHSIESQSDSSNEAVDFDS